MLLQPRYPSRIERHTPIKHVADEVIHRCLQDLYRSYYPKQRVLDAIHHEAQPIPSAPQTRLPESFQTGTISHESAPAKILPRRYELASPLDIVSLIAELLAGSTRENVALPLSTSDLTRFHSKTPPNTTVYDYLHQLTVYNVLTPPVLLTALIYVVRLCEAQPGFELNCLTVHRLFLACVTVASKSVSDSFWKNAYYAYIGGVSARELSMLELELLRYLNWNVVTRHDELFNCYVILIDRHAGYQL